MRINGLLKTDSKSLNDMVGGPQAGVNDLSGGSVPAQYNPDIDSMSSSGPLADADLDALLNCDTSSG